MVVTVAVVAAAAVAGRMTLVKMIVAEEITTEIIEIAKSEQIAAKVPMTVGLKCLPAAAVNATDPPRHPAHRRRAEGKNRIQEDLELISELIQPELIPEQTEVMVKTETLIPRIIPQRDEETRIDRKERIDGVMQLGTILLRRGMRGMKPTVSLLQVRIEGKGTTL